MERTKQIMNRFTNKILMLSAILAAFAIAPMASYGRWWDLTKIVSHYNIAATLIHLNNE
jgi:hypothetical protein